MNVINIKNVLKNLGNRHVVTIFISIVLTLGAIGYISDMLYQSVNKDLELRSEMDVIQSSDRFSQYLMLEKSELTLTGYTVNGMLIRKADNKQIQDFMKAQSRRIKRSLDKSFTGLYGYINGEYLAGSGGEHDKGFAPKESPWYKAAVEHPHETVYADPNVDKQTGKVMITVASLLSDGESVIALDIDLDGIQDITDDIGEKTPGAMVLVLDGNDVVIAHSDKKEVGRNYSKEEGTLGELISKKINNKKGSYKIDYKDKSYMVFSEKIEGGWKCASVIDTEYYYKPLKRVIMNTVLIGILSFLLLIFIFYRLSLRDLIKKNLQIQIGAAADIYEYFIDINLEDDSYHDINGRIYEEGSDLSYSRGIQKKLFEKVDEDVEEASRPIMHEFVDFSTLNTRLNDKETIAIEYLDKEHTWYRARLICAERLPDGTIARVLLGTENIDAEKKEREALRDMAEKDLMTGLLNRVTGETTISSMLADGKGGMFVLFDIDHFKTFNDTFGHSVGDKVIISVADCLKNSFRGDDIIMRLGGDEFAAYAAGVHTKAAGQMILDRFYDNMDKVVIGELGSEKLTVSAGAAFSPDGEVMSFKEIYELADESMYECKKSYQFHTAFAGCFRDQS